PSRPTYSPAGRLQLPDLGSAEPDRLVLRCGVDDRQLLIEDAPETYYLTDYYRSYPLVLVRLPRANEAMLRELLSQSWRMTSAKTRKPAGRLRSPHPLKTNRSRSDQPR
ncbi:MAG: hypothetical protein ABI972_30335, partial [Acidobacteriota bacterium]